MASGMDQDKRLEWKENERGLHLSLKILDETYSATGITVESALEVLVLALADTVERILKKEPDLTHGHVEGG
jgi:hypothetical protein